MYTWEMSWFNCHHGFLEGIVRGHRAGLLTAPDYNNLCQCENLEDIKLNLGGSDYANYVQNAPSPLSTTGIIQKCMDKLVADWKHMRANADEPLATFMDYCTYGHMIDNVVLMVTGTLHEREVGELMEKCHPLGMFDSIATVAAAQSMKELYRLVLVDTPLAPYFSECLTSDDLDEMNIEVMRNTLHRAYLEDFHRLCQSIGGGTAAIMGELLAFEADRRALNITLNSIGTELTREDRRRLYASLGQLHPTGHYELSLAEDYDAVRTAVEKVPQYKQFFSQMSFGESQMLDKILYTEDVRLMTACFEQQFHFGVFYAFLRLREQEIRNIMWISECISQGQKHRVQDGIVIIF
ncbi:unnamed protein product [Pedinophyceae sp. YPF-701]|nr:unnamed protein product [Pedinophyceae sp. YPF-701]